MNKRKVEEVKIPEHPLPFQPRPFQKEVFDKIVSTPRNTLLQLPSRSRGRYSVGVDMGQPGGDHTVISHVKMNGKGQIVKVWFDEYGTLPDYKWYRNPIKWWKWRKLMKKLTRQSFDCEWRKK